MPDIYPLYPTFGLTGISAVYPVRSQVSITRLYPSSVSAHVVSSYPTLTQTQIDALQGNISSTIFLATESDDILTDQAGNKLTIG